jgi:hypothetical protein
MQRNQLFARLAPETACFVPLTSMVHLKSDSPIALLTTLHIHVQPYPGITILGLTVGGEPSEAFTNSSVQQREHFETPS